MYIHKFEGDRQDVGSAGFDRMSKNLQTGRFRPSSDTGCILREGQICEYTLLRSDCNK